MRRRGLAALVALAGLAAGCAGRPPAPAPGAAGPAPPERRMAVTVDDLPAGPPGAHTTAEQERLTAGLLAALVGHGVPAVGFVNEDRLEVDGRVDPGRVALLERWLAAGFELGNHTYSHPDLHRVPVEDFLADAARGERVLRPLAERAGRPLTWFRHPFLHTGRDLATRDRVEAFLAERGQRVAPVTVDNGEWLFGAAYAAAAAAGDAERMDRLGAVYLQYMEDVVAYYEGQARAIVGEEIPQVLLVHAYLLNAHHLGTLLGRLEARGYRFVTLGEAVAHPAYRLPDSYTGPAGITWLHRWAITAGMPPETFAGEPEVPAWVEEAAAR